MATASSPSAAPFSSPATNDDNDDSNNRSAAKEEGNNYDGGEKKQRRKKKKKKKSSKHKQTKTTTKTTATGRQTNDDDDDDNDDDDTTCSKSKNSNNNSNIPSSTLPPAAQSILEQTCHYDVLGITKSASQIEIQKAYRRRCVVTHPDKIPSGDRAAFDKVSYAYDVLRCENKRAVYDKFGHEGIENGVQDANGRFKGGGGGGMSSSSSFFGNDIFRDFFGSSSASDASFFFGGQQRRHQQQQQSNPFFKRSQQQQQMKNRNLRYQLEVTLEELYNGTTKHVAIQQPTYHNNNPFFQQQQQQQQPTSSYRTKQVEVTLLPGMANGQRVRIHGIVDSIPNAPPADIIFILRERKHPMYTRKNYDLAMEIKLSYSESIVGYKRLVTCLNGDEIIIGNPIVIVGATEEANNVKEVDIVRDATSILPDEVNSNIGNEANVTTAATNAANEQEEELEKQLSSPPTTTSSSSSCKPEQGTKTTTYYELPPTIIQTGDVHVLKGYGMPKKRGTLAGGGGGRHDVDAQDDQEYGDLYVQYIVEMPGSSSNKGVNVDNLCPRERVELARLLSKLEGNMVDPTINVVRHCTNGSTNKNDNGGGDDETMTEATATAAAAASTNNETGGIHRLNLASVSDFGRMSSTDNNHNDDTDDEYLRHDDEEIGGNHSMPRGFRSTDDVTDFVHRAFTGRSGGFGGGGPFGFGFSTYGSSTSYSGDGGGGYYNNYGGGYGEEEDHKVECNQM